jgi:glycosyltransferase involved in cell wall biosynthesis
MGVDHPIVDILLPVHNGSSTICESIDSIRMQTLRDIRIIVIDDGSSDDTLEKLTKIAKEDGRILILTKSNSGIVDALNLGLQHCEAEFIARQDADDISDPARLSVQVTYMTKNEGCAAVSCGARHIDLHGHATGDLAFHSLSGPIDPRSIPAKEPYLMHPFLMVRRSAMRMVGGYRHVYNAEDTDLYWRLGERWNLHIEDAILGSYRMHAGSISGGSILNGRVTAVGCQLAALSARRRQTGRPDICFPKEAIHEYRRLESLQGIYDTARLVLDTDEAQYLRVSVSAKLLQMAAYRPYNIEIDDARFIHDAYVENKIFSAEQLADFRFLLSTTAASLLKNGQIQEATALLPASLLGELGFRFVAPIMPQSLRRTTASLGRKITRALFLR